MIELEDRYCVIKAADLSEEQLAAFSQFMMEHRIPTRESAVVEADWPIFPHVCTMILHQEMYMEITGQIQKMMGDTD